MLESPASWISLVFLLAALVSYSINSITWLIGSWILEFFLSYVIDYRASRKLNNASLVAAGSSC